MAMSGRTMIKAEALRAWAIAFSTLLVVGCGNGAVATPSGAAPTASPATQASPSAPQATGAATIGPAEQTDLSIGIWLPNAGSVAPVRVAIDRGYFTDEGINASMIVVADTRAAVVGGSVDVGVLDIGPVAQAINEDLGIQILTAYRCRRTYVYAVRPEISTAQDLSGKDVVVEFVAGEPDGNARKALLKKNGWDLDAVSPAPNYVIVPGFSNATTKLFVAGKLFGQPVYPQTRTATLEAGGKLVVDEESDWPNDVVFAETSWVASHPNTAARMLRAIMRGIADTLDMSQQAAIVAQLKADGVAVENEEKTLAAGGIALDQNQYCLNMYFDQPQTYDLFNAQSLNPLPAWDRLADIKPLLAAQASNGMTNDLPPIPGS